MDFTRGLTSAACMDQPCLVTQQTSKSLLSTAVGALDRHLYSPEYMYLQPRNSAAFAGRGPHCWVWTTRTRCWRHSRSQVQGAAPPATRNLLVDCLALICACIEYLKHNAAHSTIDALVWYCVQPLLCAVNHATLCMRAGR